MSPWVVVGLGNPGSRYAANRHNIGQMIVDTLADRCGGRFRSHRGHAQIATVRMGTAPGGVPGPGAVLTKTTTYMNVSGPPVASVLSMHGAPEHLVVVHDDLDIPFGQVRLKLGGGEGGHNGLRSISAALGTRDYIRIRVGIGRPPGRMDPADYVLRDFSPTERRELPWVVEAAADAVGMVLTQGLAAAQQRFHTPA